jgi:hypothetical protein
VGLFVNIASRITRLTGTEAGARAAERIEWKHTSLNEMLTVRSDERADRCGITFDVRPAGVRAQIHAQVGAVTVAGANVHTHVAFGTAEAEGADPMAPRAPIRRDAAVVETIAVECVTIRVVSAFGGAVAGTEAQLAHWVDTDAALAVIVEAAAPRRRPRVAGIDDRIRASVAGIAQRRVHAAVADTPVIPTCDEGCEEQRSKAAHHDFRLATSPAAHKDCPLERSANTLGPCAGGSRRQRFSFSR